MKQIKGTWFPDRDLSSLQAIKKAEHMVVKGYYFDALEEGLSYVTDWSVAIDGGANIGLWSIIITQRFETVYSFEIDPETFQCLQKNIQEKNLHNCIAVNSGLSNIESYRQLADGWNAKSMGCHLAPTAKRKNLTARAKSNIRKDQVKTVMIDNLNLPSLGFLKLDVEGHEYQVIEGARETLAKFKPIIMMEYKPTLNKRYGKNDPAVLLNHLGAYVINKTGKKNVEWIFGWK